jgi:hypothetical protein
MAATRKPCAKCKNPTVNSKYCRTCAPIVKKERKHNAHETRVAATYGLRPGEYEKLYLAQGGKCAVKDCRATGRTKLLAVEHDHHVNGKRESIRGLMCSMHNNWIGKANDDPTVFESIAEYLRHPPAFDVLGTNGRGQDG